MVGAVRDAAGALGYTRRDIVSAPATTRCTSPVWRPRAMIFVPCEGGISHNEIENATPQDLAAGCNVLLHAALSRAA